MAVAENGPDGHYRGRLGNKVYYILNGIPVVRVIGKYTDDPSDKQLTIRTITVMCSELFPKLKDFFKIGFKAIAIAARDNTYNQAIKANRPQVFSGEFPELHIHYDKLLVSKGPLKQAQNWKLSQTEDGLLYSWDTDPAMPWPEVNDQVMMLAYFPSQGKVFFTLYGNARSTGSDLLEIPPSLRNEYMETYISFISADRAQVADSLYTGSFNLQLPEASGSNS